MATARTVAIEISPGELIDRISILQIKREKFSDPLQLQHIRKETDGLTEAGAGILESSPKLVELASQLKAVNQLLWQIEDDIRRCEQAKDFGPRFVELARSVYRNNDRRSALKRDINHLLGSELVEEKLYADYD